MAAHSHQFTLTGGVRDIADGEVFAGKGILLTRLKTPEGVVAFYNTHVRERSTVMYVRLRKDLLHDSFIEKVIISTPSSES